MVPDRITLQNMEKKSNEGFRQYTQRWREVEVQVQPPIFEREMTMLFVNMLKVPFITHMLGSATKNFADIVMSGEMIESAVKSGKIDVGENNRRQNSKKKESEVNNVNTYNKSITVNQPRKPPYPKRYDANAQCDYHAGVVGHSIEHCTAFKRLVEKLIKMGVVKVDDSSGTGKKVKENIAESMMDNGEIEFFEEVEGKESICASESETRIPKVNHPVIIISRPKVTVSGKETSISVVKESQKTGSYTNTDEYYSRINAQAESAEGEVLTAEQKEEWLLINEPIKEEEATEFLRFLKHSEYSVVEQLHKQPARISLLVLLMSSEVNNISADNFIFFNDDEIPSRGMKSTKALYITARCKGSMVSVVLIDNGKEGLRRIEISLQIGPNTYEVVFIVMDIPSYNCLLERPWIHSVGAVPSSLHQKLKLVTEGRNATYMETDEEAVKCSFRTLEFLNATFMAEGNIIPIPKISRTTRMGLQLMVGKGAVPGKGLGRYLQGGVEAPVMKGKFDHFGLGYRPDVKQRRKEIERRHERRRARRSGNEVRWELMAFPHISKTFISGGFIHPERRVLEVKGVEDLLGDAHINALDTVERETLLEIRPYEPRSDLDNWTAEEIPIVFRACSESPNINDMNDAASDSESPFEQDRCLGGSQNFEDDEDKQILPHKESLEIVSLEEGKEVKIRTDISAKTRQDLIELLREFKNVFAWSYQDMPGLRTDIVVHRLPIKEDCKPVQQNLRRMRPDIALKIKEEVTKQFDAGFLQEVKYSEWVANVVPIPKKDGKVRMCVDYRDLNRASPKDNFSLPHIDTLGTFCYKVMPFGLKNAGATYQRAMVNLFHYMMHKEIEVYVDDMIAKSRTEEEHVQVLRKLFLRLRNFQLKLNPTKCTFGARSGKLLGFIVSGKGIEVDPDKVRAIRDLPPPHTQKKVRGFLGRLNYISRFISQLTEKCDPIFRLPKKHNPGIWDKECPKAFEKIKQYLSNPPVLSPPNPDRPLILYLTVFDNSMGCVLRQHDEIRRKERAIYYLSKKFIDCEARYSAIEKLCCALKAVKGSGIAKFLASRALVDYEPLNFYFPNEDLMYVATTEENPQMDQVWKLNFDGASNAVGRGIGAVLISPSGDHYPFASKLDFDCTNNMAEYEACIMGIRAAIERKIKVLEVYGDSALNVCQDFDWGNTFGMEAVLPIEIEIPSLRILSEMKLDEAE
ncbi:uncharacterized protein LOC105781470 [Gossypium raimondii]|uniref:uncharacterized protein LOC105781470 n=1 Tax=Gossypium raimondii TaxID=29730 RepID=UPI00063AB736|nr:uncharacterized protein LOC105781470 [Gossypium raimondii]